MIDELTILGPIEAWRFWRVGFHQPENTLEPAPRLHSVTYAGYCWPTKKAADSSWGHRYVCLYLSHFMKERESTTLKKKEFSAFSCECGIYGWKDVKDASERLDTYQNTVMGKVALWGRGIKSEAGYRTEYGYPLFLSGAVCSFCGKLVPLEETSVVGEKVSPVIQSYSPVLNYRIVCKSHLIDESIEEKAPSSWYYDLLEEYGIHVSQE